MVSTSANIDQTHGHSQGNNNSENGGGAGQ